MGDRGRTARASRAAPRTRAPPRATARTVARPSRLRAVAAALAAHPTATAAGAFGLLVLAYLWPVLLGGEILSPNAVLYGFTPYKGIVPHDIHSYYNELLTDIPTADYPWRFFARELIHQGTLPAWSPRAFGGVPFYSNPQTGIFSLFSLPLWILPLNYGIGVSAALKLSVGAFGMYLLVRQLRLGLLPGLLAGACFAFCSFNITWLTHETLPAVAVLLPWMVWLVERIFERGRLASCAWLAAVTAIALGGGHPGMQLHVIVVTGCYALLRAAFLRDVPRRELLRPLALACGGLALGTLTMGLMVVPELLSTHGTIGTLARKGGRGTLPGSLMPFRTILSVLFPDWWGRPSGLMASGTGVTPPMEQIVNYNERTFYTGAVALILAGVGLAGRERWRRKAPFAVLAMLGLAIALHAPGLYQLVEHVPGLDLVQNQRLHFAFAFGVCVLAAFGLQAVIERPRGDRGRLAVPLVALLAGVVAFGAIRSSGADLRHLVTHFLTGRDFQSNVVLALTSVSWFLLFAAGATLALLAARRWPRHATAVAAAIVLLAVADMLHFAHGYQPMGPASKVIPPPTPAVVYLQRHAGDSRIFGVEHAMPSDWGTVYGLDDIRGYDPPQPTARYFRLWRTINPEQLDWQPFAFEGVNADVVRLISPLGARYLIADAGARLLPAIQRETGLRRVYGGRDATIFLNDRAMPRAMVAQSVELSSGEQAARTRLVAPTFDARRAAIVERGEPGAATLAGGAPVHGSVRIARQQNARVTLDASLDRRGLVVLDETLADGWSVRVDGRSALPVRVDDVMRGVVVGAGRHEIVWSYRVPGLRLGLVLSGLGLALLAALALRSRKGRHRG